MSHPRNGTKGLLAAFTLLCAPAVAAELVLQKLEYPFSRETIPVSLDAQGIAGFYVDSGYFIRGFYLDAAGYHPVGKPIDVQVVVAGTSGGHVVGRYQYVIDPLVLDPVRAFFWDGSNRVDLIPPLAKRDVYTVGISGGLVAGYYRDAAEYVHGFVWDGARFTTLDAFNSPGTWPRAISGHNVVGDYIEVVGMVAITRGFLWDGTSYHPVDPPGSEGTWVTAVDSTDVVGLFAQGEARHGFIWNGTHFTTLDPPESAITQPQGVHGGRVVGGYWVNGTTHGFLWDGSNYTPVNVPGAAGTWLHAIWGNRMVGYYRDAAGRRHGFQAILVEPTPSIRISSTNVLAGADGTVPLRLTASAGLTNVSVVLATSEDWLGPLTLQAAGNGIVPHIERLAADRLRLELALEPTLGAFTDRVVAHLGFHTAPGHRSVIVPLSLSHPVGTLEEGHVLPRLTAHSGQVIVIADEPVITIGPPPWISVTLFGQPGTDYELQSTGSLSGTGWHTVTNVTLSVPFVSLDDVGVDTPATFYRARRP